MRYFIFLLLLLPITIRSQDALDNRFDKAESLRIAAPDSALFLINELLKKEDLSQEDLCQCMELKGNALTRLGEYDSAIITLKMAISFCENSEGKRVLADVYNALGFIHDRQEMHEASLEYFIKSAELFDQLKDYEGTLKAYLNIVSILGQSEQFDKVKDYIGAAEFMLDEVKDPYRKIQFYSSAAAHFVEIGVDEKLYLDSALMLSKKGLLLSRNLNAEDRFPDFYLVFTTVHALQNNNSLALAYCDSLFMHEEKANYRELILGNIRYAEIHSKLDDFKKSEFYFARADSLIKEVNSTFYQMVLIESQYKVYKRFENWETSLAYLEQLKELEQVVFSIESDKKISELEVRFQAERRQNEILNLENQVSKVELQATQKNWFILGITLISLFIALTIWLYYQKKLSRAREQSAIHKQQLLRSQINPHFIFNSLSSIRGFLFSGGDTKPAINYLGRFAKLMRMVLELSSKEWVTLEEEVRALELYLSIQQIRFKDAFEFSLTIDSSIDPSDIIVPPLTAQPFIENAIEHGLKGMEKNGKVEVTCLKESGKLVFKIQDNGIGVDHIEPTKNHQSRAIHIFKERLKILSRQMKTSFDFEISDLRKEPGVQGTLVMYELPFVKS